MIRGDHFSGERPDKERLGRDILEKIVSPRGAWKELLTKYKLIYISTRYLVAEFFNLETGERLDIDFKHTIHDIKCLLFLSLKKIHILCSNLLMLQDFI